MSEYRKTYTQPADTSDEFMKRLEDMLSKGYEWVDISQSMPVIINHKLFYTITVTAGELC